jgi:hypothetical protein
MAEDPHDLAASLAGIERKLRELQDELQAVARGARAPAYAEPPPAPAPPPPVSGAGERLGELARRVDELRRLSLELDDALRALQDEYERAVTPAVRYSGDVVMRAGPFRNVAALSDFERTVAGLAGVDEAYVRSFAGDRALLDVRLDGEADLVWALRAALAEPVRVVRAAAGELEIALGP